MLRRVNTRIAAFTILAFFLACGSAIAQMPFLGLRAGISTRPEVERVLGRPVRQVSPTLTEFAPKQIRLKAESKSISTGKIYVQYRDSSAAAVVERIEMILCRSAEIKDNACDLVAMHREYDGDPDSDRFGGSLDMHQKIGDMIFWYFGAPRYMVRTDKTSPDMSSSEARWAFYSKELYEATAPEADCTGVLRGEWETNRGRTTFTRREYGRLSGTYAENNGTFTGKINGDALQGEWKDSTGSGTMLLMLYFPGSKQFSGSWERTTGKGLVKGTWEGRCVTEKEIVQ